MLNNIFKFFKPLNMYNKTKNEQECVDKACYFSFRYKTK